MLLLFIAICFWTFSSKRDKDFAEAARLPLDEDAERELQRMLLRAQESDEN